jgi:hypothetical protein
LSGSFLIDFAHNLDIGFQFVARLGLGGASKCPDLLESLCDFTTFNQVARQPVCVVPAADPIGLKIGDFSIGCGDQIEGLEDIE